MESKPYELKKRIVFTALKPYLSQTKLVQALLLWDKKYANAPSSTIKHFVYDIRSSVDEKADIRGIHLNLVKTSFLSDEELEKYPSEQISAYIAKHELPQDVDYTLPELEAMQALITKWHQSLTPQQSELLGEYIYQNLHSQNINSALKFAILAWLRNNHKPIKVPSASTSELRRVTNLYYVASCELIGPVASDQLLKNIVHALKSNGYANYEHVINQFI